MSLRTNLIVLNAQLILLTHTLWSQWFNSKYYWHVFKNYFNCTKCPAYTFNSYTADDVWKPTSSKYRLWVIVLALKNVGRTGMVETNLWYFDMPTAAAVVSNTLAPWCVIHVDTLTQGRITQIRWAGSQYLLDIKWFKWRFI